ncbi:MAG: hypothetical protein Q8L55_03240 [Phycisphaerales bacterium]|nr:hypothetical protein [Phycisphaerales bacterium]
MVTQQQLETLLPMACAWAEAQEAEIVLHGVPLTTAQCRDAQTIGVRAPEKVRLLKVPSIPVPANPVLRDAAEKTGLLSPSTAGLALRYGIVIRADCWNQRPLIFHELVHTLQYERMGGFMPFLKQYLLECVTIGYPAAPMEQEAVNTTAELCR